MKKTLLSIAVLASVPAAFAQKDVGTARQLAPVAVDDSRATDTLFSASVFNSPTLYGVVSSIGGYIFGSNGYGDKAKAQQFILSGSSTSVEEVLFWVGGKSATSGNPGSHVSAKIYLPNGPGENLSGPINNAPGTVVGTVDIPLSDMDSSSTLVFSVGAFAAPVWVQEIFMAGLDVSTLAAGDSVGLVSSEDGDVDFGEFAWEKWSDNTWWTLPAAGWGGGAFDADAGIFVVIDNSTIGIDDPGTLNNMRLSFLNGNIVTDNMLIGYDVVKDARMNLMVHDQKGRLVHQANLGQKAAGSYQYAFDTQGWASGNYYLTLKADGRPITKKFAKQ